MLFSRGLDKGAQETGKKKEAFRNASIGTSITV